MCTRAAPLRLGLNGSDAQVRKAQFPGRIHGGNNRLMRSFAIGTDDHRPTGIAARFLTERRHQGVQIMLDQRLAVETEVAIDVDKFDAETARLIKNFDAFFDIEELVYNKARSFLMDKYGEEIADEVAELLDVRHDITEKEKSVAAQQEFEEQVPIAVGASGGAGP